jgi:hypothetical protein
MFRSDLLKVSFEKGFLLGGWGEVCHGISALPFLVAAVPRRPVRRIS